MSRLLDPMKRPPVDDKPAEFPFPWTMSHSTNVRETWDRMCPGWRERKPGDKEEPKVALISRRTRK